MSIHLCATQYVSLHIATSVTVSRQEATPPQTLLTVTASDADGDTLRYTLTPTSVS